MDEKGYIKFNCNWIKSDPVSFELIKEINFYRKILFDKGLIGMYPNGIGYGNVSIRLNNDTFLITGTSTGNIQDLTTDHYTKVMHFNFKNNSVTCEGPIKASSESLTHAAIYISCSEANAVVHVHNKNLWDSLLYSMPSTSPGIEYGTPGMAEEVSGLFKKTDLMKKRIIIMAGHEEGIITFGKSIKEACNTILSYI
jgi:L-ribulose-5-phosphate 4-epimerase